MPSHISEDYIMAQKKKKSVLKYRFDLPFISHESFVKMDRGKMIFVNLEGMKKKAECLSQGKVCGAAFCRTPALKAHRTLGVEALVFDTKFC